MTQQKIKSEFNAMNVAELLQEGLAGLFDSLPSYFAVFRLILLLVNVLRVRFGLEVYIVTEKSLKINHISHSSVGLC